MYKSIWLVGLALSVTAQSHQWVIPWAANKDGAWSSQIAINNHGSQTIDIDIEAIRVSGEREAARVTISGGEQFVADIGELFPVLGSGSGYSVYLRSDSESLSAAVKVSSLATTSGDSPSMGSAVKLDQAANRLIFPFMPYSGGGAAAPVIVNATAGTATVEISAYGAGGFLGQTEVNIGPYSPFADVIDSLFPGLNDASYLVAESDAALVGMSFNFNAIREPSMMNAQPSITATEEDVYAMVATLEMTAAISNGYSVSTDELFRKEQPKRACPEYDWTVDRNNESGYVRADFDWGSGCSNVFGIYHSGSINLNMDREGSLQTGGWMNGSLTFDQFTTRYLGSEVFIDGQTHIEGSTRSSNFTLTGNWTATATVPISFFHGEFTSSTFLSINKKESDYVAYGHLSVRFGSSYYAAMTGEVSQSDPLIFNFAQCPWPTSGKIVVTVDYGYAMSGWLDFGTGDCQTATLYLNGVTSTLYLPGIYT